MDEIRDELRQIAEDAAKSNDRRDEMVARARKAGMTWVEIARILGMTPHGIRKAQNRRNQA